MCFAFVYLSEERVAPWYTIQPYVCLKIGSNSGQSYTICSGCCFPLIYFGMNSDR